MIVKQLDGYFGNSINDWRDQLVKRHRRLMARCNALQRQGHPSTYGQSVLIDINAKLIAALDRQYKKAPALLEREVAGDGR